MPITFDPAKRDWTLAERGLDFAEAEHVFAGPLVEYFDERFDYGDERLITVGFMDERMVVVIWDPARRKAPHHFDEEGQRT